MPAKTFTPAPLNNVAAMIGKTREDLLAPAPDAEVILIDLDAIDPDPKGPRVYRDPAGLEKLERSIAEHGVLENIIVRRVGVRYRLVAGEGRFLCSKKLGKKTIPARVIEADDTAAAWIALIENLVRDDLSPIEETEGILYLLQLELGEGSIESTVATLWKLRNAALGNTNQNVLISGTGERVERVFAALGKKLTWKSFMSTRLPLRDLPDDLKEAMARGQIEYTKAKLLARIADRTERARLLEKAIGEGLSLTRLREELENTGAIGPKPVRVERVQRFQKLLKNSRAWENEEKWTRVERLLRDIEEILEA
jgi:ParB family transcriptional regulator, chromosome partitioning protein